MLNLSHTGITDISLEYLVQSSMPKLRKLNVQGNKFTSTGKASMDALRLNQVHISFRTQSEKQKLKEKKAAKENKK
jgi:Leucine-rich repeat (LRR) protein